MVIALRTKVRFADNKDSGYQPIFCLYFFYQPIWLKLGNSTHPMHWKRTQGLQWRSNIWFTAGRLVGGESNYWSRSFFSEKYSEKAIIGQDLFSPRYIPRKQLLVKIFFLREIFQESNCWSRSYFSKKYPEKALLVNIFFL